MRTRRCTKDSGWCRSGLRRSTRSWASLISPSSITRESSAFPAPCRAIPRRPPRQRRQPFRAESRPRAKRRRSAESSLRPHSRLCHLPLGPSRAANDGHDDKAPDPAIFAEHCKQPVAADLFCHFVDKAVALAQGRLPVIALSYRQSCALDKPRPRPMRGLGHKAGQAWALRPPWLRVPHPRPIDAATSRHICRPARSSRHGCRVLSPGRPPSPESDRCRQSWTVGAR